MKNYSVECSQFVLLQFHRKQSILRFYKMPPLRDFSGKADYMQRNLHDDLLEQLRNSINDVVKGYDLIPINPKMMVGEGFYD